MIESAAIPATITNFQPHGWQDRQYRDNLVWTPPISDYDETDALPAAAVDLTDARHFTAKRSIIRAALIADGIAAEMENMVDALLPP